MAAHPSHSSTTESRPPLGDDATEGNPSRALTVTTQLLGVLLLLAGCVLVYLLIAVWASCPPRDRPTGGRRR